MDSGLHQPATLSLLTFGFAGLIYKIDGTEFALKRPKFVDGEDHLNEDCCQQIKNERQIYERLRKHRGLIGYYGYDAKYDGTKLDYASDGDLANFIQASPKPDQATLYGMIGQLVETLTYIHSHNVVIKDFKPHNVLIHHGEPKISDFTESEMFPTDGKMADVCPKDILKLDLLGAGCIIYSIETWDIFYYDYYDEQSWPSSIDLKSTENLHFGHVIEKCWQGTYGSVEELQKEVEDVINTKG